MFGRFHIADAISAQGMAPGAPVLVTIAKKTETTTTA
jgi:hypothetical protein